MGPSLLRPAGLVLTGLATLGATAGRRTKRTEPRLGFARCPTCSTAIAQHERADVIGCRDRRMVDQVATPGRITAPANAQPYIDMSSGAGVRCTNFRRTKDLSRRGEHKRPQRRRFDRTALRHPPVFRQLATARPN